MILCYLSSELGLKAKGFMDNVDHTNHNHNNSNNSNHSNNIQLIVTGQGLHGLRRPGAQRADRRPGEGPPGSLSMKRIDIGIGIGIGI